MELVFLFLLGLIIGSFLNVVIYRLPHKESLWFPRSYCPNCKRPLKWYHNIPLLSYLFLKGKCAYCKKSISIQYPLVELISGLLLITLYLKFGIQYGYVTFLVLAIFCLDLLCLSFIDLYHKEIPDILSLPLIFLGWIFAILGKNPLGLNFYDSLISSFAGMGLLFFINELYYLVTQRDGMGMGDFKLMGALGSFLGFNSFFNILFFASLFGILGFLVFRLYEKIKGKREAEEKILRKEIPFGPFLSLAGLFYLFNPQSLL